MLDKYCKSWSKVKSPIKKIWTLNLFTDNYLNTKIKSYENEVKNIDF